MRLGWSRPSAVARHASGLVGKEKAMKIMVLIGSVRDVRAGKPVADWVMNQLKDFDGNCTFDLVDLKSVNLPLMDEPIPPSVGKPYAHEHTKNWSTQVSSYDGFIFLVAEYNKGYTAVLKNAIDYLCNEWKGKPVGLVGYGGSGAERAIRQLREVLAELEMRPLEYQVGISKIWEAVDENGAIRKENLAGSVLELAKQLQAAV